MKGITIFFAFFLMARLYGQSENYTPLQVDDNGAKALSEVITRSYKSILPPDVKTGINKTQLYRDCDLELKDIFRRGNVLYGDTLSNYVASVALKLSALRPVLKGAYHIYILKTTEPNAFSYPDGSILVTMGLLARLRSESQLAFVLGHEMGHLLKKHGEKEFEKEYNLEKDFKMATIGNDNSFRVLMHYSQEYEMEADAVGVELMAGAGYNPNESIKAQSIIEKDDTFENYVKIDLKKYFNSPDFNIDSIKKTSSSDSRVSVFSHQVDFSTDGPDDKHSTHPDLDKRLIAMKEIISNMQGTIPQPVQDSTTYTHIRYIAKMEDIQIAFNEGDYTESLYLSLHALDQNPKNKYLYLMVARNILWLANYEENDVLNEAIKGQNNMYGRHYKEVEKFIESLSPTDFKKLAYSYIKSHYQAGGKDEELAFYMAYIAEFYLGPGISNFYYTQYLKTFPQGKYASFAGSKLQ